MSNSQRMSLPTSDSEYASGLAYSSVCMANGTT